MKTVFNKKSNNNQLQNELRSIIFELLEEKVKKMSDFTVDEGEEVDISSEKAVQNAIKDKAEEEGYNLTINDEGETAFYNPEQQEEIEISDRTRSAAGITEGQYSQELEEIIFQEIRQALNENYFYLISGAQNNEEK